MVKIEMPTITREQMYTLERVNQANTQDLRARRNYTGMEVCREFDEYCNPIRLCNRKDVREGDSLYFVGPQGRWNAGKVRNGHLEYGGLTARLQFDVDDRHCWICGCFCNSNPVKHIIFA